MSYFWNPKVTVREARITAPKGLTRIRIQSRGNVNRHNRFLKSVETVDDIPVIAPHLRIKACAKNGIDEKIELFKILAHLSEVFVEGTGATSPLILRKI